MSHKYYLGAIGLPEKEVSKEEFMSAERAAGFRSKSPNHPATAGFSGGGMSGRVVYVFEDETPPAPPVEQPAAAPITRLGDGDLILMANKAAPHNSRDNDMFYIAMGRLVEEHYINANLGEVERLRGIIRMHEKTVQEQADHLAYIRAQLAGRDALIIQVLQADLLSTSSQLWKDLAALRLAINTEPSELEVKP